MPEKQLLLAGFLMVDCMASNLLHADFKISHQKSAINN
jgi:hypothetical protein